MTPAYLELDIRTGTVFAPMTISFDQADLSPFNLTGYTCAAKIKTEPEGTLIYDLAPTVTNAAGGQCTIPRIDDSVTATLTLGTFQWDFILIDGSSNASGPYLEGRVTIKDNITP